MESVASVCFPPERFNLLARPLRQKVARRPAHPSHPLMDRFLSSDLGRNVRSDAPQEEGRQERLGNIPVVRAHRVSAARAGDDTHRSSRDRLSSPMPAIGTTL